MLLAIIPTSIVCTYASDFSGKARHGYQILPLYEKAPCGYLNYLNEDTQGFLEIPQHMLGGGSFFALQTKGDSMINIGIKDKEIVIVRRQNFAEEGQIVVARIGNDVTVKRYFPLPKEKKILLHPENENYDDIIVNDCQILGIIVKVIKDIKEN